MGIYIHPINGSGKLRKAAIWLVSFLWRSHYGSIMAWKDLL